MSIIGNYSHQSREIQPESIRGLLEIMMILSMMISSISTILRHLWEIFHLKRANSNKYFIKGIYKKLVKPFLEEKGRRKSIFIKDWRELKKIQKSSKTKFTTKELKAIFNSCGKSCLLTTFTSI